MNIIETDYWCLMLPPEWSAEQEEDVIRIFDQDEIGELALTTLIRDRDADESSSAVAVSQSGVTRDHRLVGGHVGRLYGRLRFFRGGRNVGPRMVCEPPLGAPLCDLYLRPTGCGHG